MSDRAREWLEDRLEVLSVHGDEARVRNCLYCDRARTMKVNLEKRRFICFSCQETGGFLKLIQAVEECDRDEAVRIVRDLVKGIARARHSFEDLADRLDHLDDDPEPDQDGAPAIVYDLPSEFVPCWDGTWRIPKYLSHGRRPLKRGNLERWGIGYALAGKYADRVIIPVECAGSRSFVARRMGDKGPKYLTPGEGWDDRLLFGYDALETGGQVVAVEGVFDAIRVWSYGFQAVAYFGAQLGAHQVDLLRTRRVEDLILMPDGDDTRAVARALKDAAVLSARFPSVRVARLDSDPDESSKSEITRAIGDAATVEDRNDAFRERLKNVRETW